MHIEQRSAAVDRPWDAYVTAHDRGSFCHLSGWSVVAEQLPGVSALNLAAVSGRELRGILPLCSVRRPLLGTALISSPLCVYGGSIADSRDIELSLVREAERLADRIGASYVELRDAAVDGTWQQRSDFSTFSLPLAKQPDENLKRIKVRQRAVVRKGQEAGLVSVVDRDIERFYRLYAASVKALGTPVYPKGVFHSLVSVFDDSVDVLSVEQAGERLCSVLSFYHGNQVLPYYGAGSPAARRGYGFPFLYYSLMNHAADRDCQTFDFGRSARQSGAWHFKKNFGAEERVLTYSFYSQQASPHSVTDTQ